MTAAAVPVDRGLETAELWAFAVLAAVLLVFAARAGRHRDPVRRRGRVAVAAWVLAAVVAVATYEGAAAQPDLAAQLPYLASGALLAVILAIMGATLALA